MWRIVQSFLLMILVSGGAHAQAPDGRWPDRPLRLIVPFPAGAVTDIVARVVGAKLGERLGQPVVVENRVGASGNIGAEAVAKAPPDGYTIGLATSSTHATSMALSTSLPYDPVKDFTPISAIGDAPYVLVVHDRLPARNVAELIALAKAKPRALNYSTVGPASLAQFAGALFASMAGVELTQVPYRSATHAVVDLNEGRIEMQFGAIGASLPFIREGKLRALAVTSAKRVDALPQVPTLAEAGLAGYEAVLWTALMVPAATPATIVERLNRETRAVLAEPEVRSALAAQVLQVAPSSPEEMRERIRHDIEKWRRIAAEAGIKAE
ncbi:MAG: tripartite tricarboxylate transporter substrate binding protein [Hyphomicrobiales bacterium]|nr:tripartite tricarboxylate transporter substrate binding protein [Hyphomicrobiales bacterium]